MPRATTSDRAITSDRATTSERAPREGGQILVLFVIFLIGMIAMASLLFTGAQVLVMRRQQQNAGDAAALAAVNLMQNGPGGTSTCTAARISSTATDGTNDLYLAAKSSLITNLGWTASQVSSRLTLACDADAAYLSQAVDVTLAQNGPGFFGAASIPISTLSTAMNGQVAGGDFSVALLNPSNTSWQVSRRGCPSFLINGGVTATFEGSIIVDSKCTLADSTNGDMKAANSAFTMNMVNSSAIKLAGEYAAGTAAHITPIPTQHYRPLQPDQLSELKEPCNAIDSTLDCLGGNTALPSVNMSTNGTGICRNQDPCILTPGTYTGGMTIGSGSNPGTVLLRPGVYYLRGGGLQLKSGAARVFAIPWGNSGSGYTDATAKTDFATTLTDTQVETKFQSNCPAPTIANPTSSTCGVLLYNAPSSRTSAWSNNTDAFGVGAQGIIALRAYNPTWDTIVNNRTTFAGYKNMGFWQARTPLPTGSGTTQPAITMSGGACTILSGTYYASGGQISFGGGSCGAGGGDTALKLQFICWDLTLAGNNDFYFAYSKDFFTTPTTYGLVK